MTTSGYVVVEWNQASHQPSMACDDVHDTLDEAAECAQALHDVTAKYGRRERFTVHELGDET